MFCLMNYVSTRSLSKLLNWEGVQVKHAPNCLRRACLRRRKLSLQQGVIKPVWLSFYKWNKVISIQGDLGCVTKQGD